MSPNCSLDKESVDRCNLLIKKAQENEYDRFITIGWAYRNDCTIPIADVVKKYIIQNSQLDPKKVFSINLSRDTVGDAIFTLEFGIKYGVSELDVVTSCYHVRRVAIVFDKVINQRFKVKVFGAKIDSSVNKNIIANEKKSIEAFRNTFAYTDFSSFNSVYSTLVEKHPYYNGTVYPKLQRLKESSTISP